MPKTPAPRWCVCARCWKPWCEAGPTSPAGARASHFDFTTQGLADDTRLPLETMLTVYRISQEALTNVARHASAEDAWLRVRVERR